MIFCNRVDYQRIPTTGLVGGAVSFSRRSDVPYPAVRAAAAAATVLRVARSRRLLAASAVRPDRLSARITGDVLAPRRGSL